MNEFSFLVEMGEVVVVFGISPKMCLTIFMTVHTIGCCTSI